MVRPGSFFRCPIKLTLVLGFYFGICSSLGAQLPREKPQNIEPGQAANERLDALGDPLPPFALMRFGTNRFHHPAGISGLLLSKDEQIVVTVGRRTVIGWDSATGRALWMKTRPAGRNDTEVSAAGYGIQTMAQIPETGEFVCSSGIGEIAIYDPASGEYQKTAVPSGITSKSIAVSPDSKLFALGDSRGLVVCTRDGTEVYSILNKPDSELTYDSDSNDRLMFGGDFSYGKFTPDGKILALVSSEKPTTIQLRNAADGSAIREITGTSRIVRLDFSPDSQCVVTTERDISARLYDIASGKRLWEFVIPPADNAESYTSAVAFRPDGKQIAVGAPIGPDNSIRLLDPDSGMETGRLTGSGWKPWMLHYSADSNTLFASGWDQAIRRWDLTTNLQKPFPGGVRANGVCAVSGDDQHLAFENHDRQIHMVNLPTATTISRFQIPDVSWGQVVFSDDGTLLAGGGASPKNIHVAVWNVSSGQLLHHWDWPKGKDPHSTVEALCFSANGNRIAAAVFRQSAAYVWDLPTNRQLARVPHTRVYGVDIDADGTSLFTAGWDKHIRIWNCDTGMETKSSDVSKSLYAVALSHDESFVATVDMANNIQIFDRTLNRISVIPNQHSVSYGALQISHNDLWITAGRSSGTVQVFEIATGSVVWETKHHANGIYAVHFGASDRTLLSGAEDGQCVLLDLGFTHDSIEATHEKLFEYLLGTDARSAFLAFQRLANTPSETLTLITNWFSEYSNAQPDEAQMRHWIVALGSGNEELVTEAKNKLLAGGSAYHSRLIKELAKGRETGAKKLHLQEIVRRFEAVNKRMVSLLTILKTPDADQAIDRLLQSNLDKEMTLLLHRAQDRRKQLR